MDEREEPSLIPGQRAGAWVREHRWVILYALLLLAVLPMRDLWSPDEPDFAQCVREMRERGSWLLPYLNGLPYDEKPILFYWLMKACAVGGDWLTGGRGFDHGVAAWALRLPSVVGSVAFLYGFRRWAARFLQADVADLGVLVLASTPLWFWQSQFIQIDLVFAALLAWAWLCWLGGYLLKRGLAPEGAGQAGPWFLQAYGALGLAFLAKGPLALVLSILVLAAFLAWQRDGRILREMALGRGLLILVALAASWYLPAALKGGRDYAYALVVHQNFERATKAWDHVQPFWKYGEYVASDFFPWVLLLPALGLYLKGSGALKSPAARFMVLAFAVPFLFLSWVQSKQGKYLLMGYPFLALLMAGLLQPVTVEGVSLSRIRRLGGLLGAGLWILTLALLAAAFLHAGGAAVQAKLRPFLGPLRLMAGLAFFGALSVTVRAAVGEGRFLVRETALTLGLVYLVAGTWGFRILDPAKNYRAWTRAVAPLLEGRRVYFWQTIRSGTMVYTDHRMPELHRAEELLERLGPEDRLVAGRREWDEDNWGMDPQLRARFDLLLEVPVGGGQFLVLRRAR